MFSRVACCVVLCVKEWVDKKTSWQTHTHLRNINFVEAARWLSETNTCLLALPTCLLFWVCTSSHLLFLSHEWWYDDDASTVAKECLPWRLAILFGCAPLLFLLLHYIYMYITIWCLMITVKYVINITLFPFRTFLNESALSVYHHSSYNRLKLKVSWNSLVCWAKVKGINQEKMSLWKILRMTF